MKSVDPLRPLGCCVTALGSRLCWQLSGRLVVYLPKVTTSSSAKLEAGQSSPEGWHELGNKNHTTICAFLFVSISPGFCWSVSHAYSTSALHSTAKVLHVHLQVVLSILGPVCTQP
eukprot:428550-Rhodomonas_salina.1